MTHERVLLTPSASYFGLLNAHGFQMGIGRADATRCLRESHNDLERAVAMLTVRPELYDI